MANISLDARVEVFPQADPYSKKPVFNRDVILVDTDSIKLTADPEEAIDLHLRLAEWCKDPDCPCYRQGKDGPADRPARGS